ncbi:hypothetical protein ACER0C_001318 [Sarotherodon galilaeus]
MEEELQELRDLIAQLKADNGCRLHQERAVGSGTSATPSTSTASSVNPPTARVSVAERLVFVPRDRKCPMFRGKSGIGLNEWLEEIEACASARHLSVADEAFFLFDHLEGEAREEIKCCSSAGRTDPAKIITILQELYGCSDSYVALQEAFFSRKQQEGETLQEFSLALLGLMEKVKSSAPNGMPNADLKQLVRRQPTLTLLEIRGEAIRWECEGLPSGVRHRSSSVPSLYGIQYGVHSGPSGIAQSTHKSEISEMKELLKRQQEQLNQLTQSIARLQGPYRMPRSERSDSIICRRCQQPGHFARECDRERVPRSRPPSQAPPHNRRHSPLNMASEN